MIVSNIWRYLLSVMLCLLVFAGQAAAAGEKLVLVSVPWVKEESLQSAYAPLGELLSRKLGKQVEIDIASTYEEIGERINHRAADLGILGPKSYVEAKDQFPALIYLATCKHPTPYYNSLIITLKNSGLGSLTALAQTSFAYTEIGSTSGYLYPRQMLRKAGLDPDALFSRTYFLNKHDKVYDAIAKGAVVAGAVSSTGLKAAVEKNGDVYRILEASDPIPSNAVVAGPHLPPAMVAEIREILRGAEQDQAFIDSGSPLKGFLVKDNAFYDIVRQERDLK